MDLAPTPGEAALRDEVRARASEVTELSMGMSEDFEVAISEGATIVRIGTAIFGRRTPHFSADPTGLGK